MLRALLAQRGGSVYRPHTRPGAIIGIIQCVSVSSSSPICRNAHIDLRSAFVWVQKVVPSLETFLTLEKHLMIPLKFTVPYGDPKWPQEAWIYPLGMHCNNLRVLKNQGKDLPFFAVDDLERLNFPWNMRQHKWDVLVLPSLQKYYDINGHTDIPKDFVVPTGDPKWPEVLWNFRLGQTTMSIKHAGTYKAQRETSMDELNKINFSMQNWKERVWDSKIFPALETFRRKFGHCNVHFNFVIPDSNEWPQQTRGMRLGATVANMRCRGNYDDMADRDKDKLKAIGFVWSPEDERWTDKILPALETYSEVYKSGWVPVEFTVPNSERWPEQTRGLKLGNIFMKIRHTGSYSSYVERDRDRLDAIKVNFKALYKG